MLPGLERVGECPHLFPISFGFWRLIMLIIQHIPELAFKRLSL
jgi:hypothetical protein